MTTGTIANGESGLSARTKINEVITKLNGVADGATANASNAQLRDRGTHTGTQSADTITGLATVATSGDYDDLTNKPDLNAFVESDPTGVTGADAITNIISLTQAEYNAIVSPSSTTLYVIAG